MSELKTTSLSHKDNNTGTPNITMYPDGTTSIGLTHTGGLKNQLINGNIVVRQRVMTGNSGFVCDRFFVDHAADTANDGPPGLERVIFAGGSTNCQVRQAIELDNPNKQNQFAPGTTWTASVWARSPAGVPSFAFTYRKGLQDSTGEQQVFNPVWQLMSSTGETAGSSANASNVYTRYSYSFTMPDLQSSISSNSLTCVVANFRFEGDYRATGFTVEPGPTATVFEMRPIGLELSLCQRYYLKGWSLGQQLVISSGTVKRSQASFPQTMRATPTFTNPTTNNGTVNNVSGSSNNIIIKLTGANAAQDGLVNGDWTADAEL